MCKKTLHILTPEEKAELDWFVKHSDQEFVKWYNWEYCGRFLTEEELQEWALNKEGSGCFSNEIDAIITDPFSPEQKEKHDNLCLRMYQLPILF
jgi:hypothetical protein